MTMLLRFILRLLMLIVGFVLFLSDVGWSIVQAPLFLFTGKVRVNVLGGLVTHYVLKTEYIFAGVKR